MAVCRLVKWWGHWKKKTPEWHIIQSIYLLNTNKVTEHTVDVGEAIKKVDQRYLRLCLWTLKSRGLLPAVKCSQVRVLNLNRRPVISMAVKRSVTGCKIHYFLHILKSIATVEVLGIRLWWVVLRLFCSKLPAQLTHPYIQTDNNDILFSYNHDNTHTLPTPLKSTRVAILYYTWQRDSKSWSMKSCQNKTNARQWKHLNQFNCTFYDYFSKNYQNLNTYLCF